MRIGILQLSDIHLQPSRKFALTRVDRIGEALNSADIEWDSLLIVLSGDIAYSGLKTEYAIAKELIENLIDILRASRPSFEHATVSIPGNHDCDYSVPENATRLVLLGVYRSDPSTLPSEGSPIENLLAVQNAQEAFDKLISGRTVERTPRERVWEQRSISIGGVDLTINLVNTALACQRWPNRKDTDQGKLFVPTHFLPTTDRVEGSPYTITVMHHPLNWLEANNAVDMRHRLSQSSDLILTGHQHEEDAESKDAISRDTCLLVRAAALQEETGSGSGFNFVVIDFDRNTEEVIQFRWKQFHYGVEKRREWSRDVNLIARPRKALLADKIRKELSDPGTGYTHPHYKKQLLLDDIFVAPKLIGLLPNSKKETTDNEDERQEVALTQAPLTILIGETKSGKSSLGKKVVRYLYEENELTLPIKLNADVFDASHLTPDRLWRAIERTAEMYYGADYLERYGQLPHIRRAIIIDDWQSSSLNDEGKKALLALLESRFHKILIIGDESVKPERIAESLGDTHAKARMSAYKISPFGHLFRSKLIKKWHTLGREHTVSREILHGEIKQSERVLNTTLGNNLVPAYPFFILSLLQLHDSIKTSHHANGSYGYLYESLITAALAQVSKFSTDIDVFYSVLGRSAFEMYSRGATGMTSPELDRVMQSFASDSKAVLDASAIKNSLLRAQILSYADGTYQFKYRYIYYFFVARYLADQIRITEKQNEYRAIITEVAKDIRLEDNANIVIFLIYLTRDQQIIGSLIDQASKLFADYPLFDGDMQAEFLSPKVVTGHRFRLDISQSPEDNSDEERKALDEGLESPPESQTNDVDEEDAEFAKAIKLMDILGQAVRNFPASMPGDTKLAVTAEVYKLGLRILGSIMQGMRDHQDTFREFLASAVTGSESAPARASDEQVAKKVDRLVAVFASLVVFNIIKTITNSVGIAQLRPVYDEVKEQLSNPKATPALQLIDLSISLDHGESFPKDNVLKLDKSLSDKWFAGFILRQLVTYRFMMFHVDRTTAQSVGSSLGIDMTSKEIVAQLATDNSGTEVPEKKHVTRSKLNKKSKP